MGSSRALLGRPADGAVTTPHGRARRHDAGWLRAARHARWLAWASLAWMCVEGGVGLLAGIESGSIALVAWALGSAVEALASVVVVWRFSGWRTRSETAERVAQRGVAVSFFLLAPYVGAEATRDLLTSHHPGTTFLGIAVTAVALLEMPLLGRAKQRLGDRLTSGATKGEGRQNVMCGVQAAGVLLGLAVTALWSGGWWADPTIAIGIALWAFSEGIAAWRGEVCTC